MNASNVIELATDKAVEDAWQSYVEWARPLLDNPGLLIDRAYREELARRDDKWRRLFLMNGRAA